MHTYIYIYIYTHIHVYHSPLHLRAGGHGVHQRQQGRPESGDRGNTTNNQEIDINNERNNASRSQCNKYLISSLEIGEMKRGVSQRATSDGGGQHESEPEAGNTSKRGSGKGVCCEG